MKMMRALFKRLFGKKAAKSRPALDSELDKYVDDAIEAREHLEPPFTPVITEVLPGEEEGTYTAKGIIEESGVMDLQEETPPLTRERIIKDVARSARAFGGATEATARVVDQFRAQLFAFMCTWLQTTTKNEIRTWATNNGIDARYSGHRKQWFFAPYPWHNTEALKILHNAFR